MRIANKDVLDELNRYDRHYPVPVWASCPFCRILMRGFVTPRKHARRCKSRKFNYIQTLYNLQDLWLTMEQIDNIELNVETQLSTRSRK